MTAVKPFSRMRYRTIRFCCMYLSVPYLRYFCIKMYAFFRSRNFKQIPSTQFLRETQIKKNTLILLCIEHLFQVYVNVWINLSRIPILATTCAERKPYTNSHGNFCYVCSKYPLFTLFHSEWLRIICITVAALQIHWKKSRPKVTVREHEERNRETIHG